MRDMEEADKERISAKTRGTSFGPKSDYFPYANKEVSCGIKNLLASKHNF